MGQNAMVLYLESLLPIACIQTENRYDKFPLSPVPTIPAIRITCRRRDGTAHRNLIDGVSPPNAHAPVIQPSQGGDLRWRVAKVTSAESAAAITMDPFVGDTAAMTAQHWLHRGS